MSITNEKLQTIKDNVSKVYRSGQMDVIKNANSLKGFESSKAMLLDDVSPVEHEMNVKVRGKNLFSLANRTWANFGANDPTAVRNISKDNFYFKITANNYAVNSTTNYEIIDGNSIKITTTNAYGLGVPFHLIAGQQYTISCIKSDDIKCRINIGYYDIEGIYLSGKYNVSTFTMPENAYWAMLCFVGFISSGTAEELTFTNIQLELGTATDYESYNSDIQNVYSKNLIPYPYRDLKLGTSTYNGVDFTVYEDGSILINGTATSNTTRYLYNNATDLLGLKSGIIISGSKNASDDAQQGNIYFMCNYYDSTGSMKQGLVASTNSSGKTTITDDWKGLGIYLHIPSGKTLNNLLIKPQLEIGSTATYYEKYHEPYPLVVSRYGKNLFNPQLLLAATGWSVDENGVYSGLPINMHNLYSPDNGGFPISFKTGLTYAVSFYAKADLADNERSLYIRFKYTDGTQDTLMIDSTEYKLYKMTSTKDIAYMCSTYNNSRTTYIKDFMIEIGSTATEYEPYITPTEYTPTTDGIINGVKNLYPNTTLISNGDRVYIDCNYYKDVDKAYNKLSAEIALSGGE